MTYLIKIKTYILKYHNLNIYANTQIFLYNNNGHSPAIISQCLEKNKTKKFYVLMDTINYLLLTAI